eukprot:6067177-Amphidinium_carterae.1
MPEKSAAERGVSGQGGVTTHFTQDKKVNPMPPSTKEILIKVTTLIPNSISRPGNHTIIRVAHLFECASP